MRLTRDRDNDDEAPRGFSGGGIGGTTLRLFTVGRIMCETGYFPVSQATFGCWVKISQETYTGPGQHLRAGITTGHPRQRWDEIGYGRDVCLFQRKTNRLPYARPGGPLLPTIPEGFSPPLDPCPSVCEGTVRAPWKTGQNDVLRTYAYMDPCTDRRRPTKKLHYIMETGPN